MTNARNSVQRRMLLLLRSAAKDSIFNFSRETINKELPDKALFFHHLLLALANPISLSQSRNTERYPGVCAAAAILLKNRDKGMSLLPYAISTTLKVWRTSKKVSAAPSVFCLSPFNLSSSSNNKMETIFFFWMTTKVLESSQIKVSQ